MTIAVSYFDCVVNGFDVVFDVNASLDDLSVHVAIDLFVHVADLFVDYFALSIDQYFSGLCLVDLDDVAIDY